MLMMERLHQQLRLHPHPRRPQKQRHRVGLPLMRSSHRTLFLGAGDVCLSHCVIGALLTTVFNFSMMQSSSCLTHLCYSL